MATKYIERHDGCVESTLNKIEKAELQNNEW